MNNHYIRTAMIKANLNQSQLAKILGCSQASVSIMLRRELSRAEQKKIVAMIIGGGPQHCGQRLTQVHGHGQDAGLPVEAARSRFSSRKLRASPHFLGPVSSSGWAQR